MTVHTVVAEVQHASCEPLGLMPFAFNNLLPGSNPVEFGGSLSPEISRILYRPPIEGLVGLFAGDVCPLRKAGWRRKNAVFAQEGIERNEIRSTSETIPGRDTPRAGRVRSVCSCADNQADRRVDCRPSQLHPLCLRARKRQKRGASFPEMLPVQANIIASDEERSF